VLAIGFLGSASAHPLAVCPSFSIDYILLQFNYITPFFFLTGLSVSYYYSPANNMIDCAISFLLLRHACFEFFIYQFHYAIT
jgi:hypothetical protein